MEPTSPSSAGHRCRAKQPTVRTRVRHVVMTMIAAAFIALAGGLLGDLLTPAHLMVGPHRADLRVTLARSEVIDLGPLGTLAKPSQFAPFGFRITVKEIPAARGGRTDGLSLEEYARLYSDFGDVRARAVRAVLEHTMWCALVALAVSAVLIPATRAALGAARRAELVEAYRRRRRSLVAGTLALALAVAALAAVPASAEPGARPSALLDGTPLEGATVNGALLQLLVNDYGPRVGAFVERTSEFSDRMSRAVGTAFADSAPLLASRHVDTVLFTVGLHCNLAMAAPIGRVVALWKPTVVLSGGDDALGATGFEGPCIDSLARHLGDSTVVVAPGDHDSAEAERQMRDHGFKVLDGRSVEVRGLRIVGDDDPRIARFGAGISPRRNETVTQMGERLARVACADPSPVDVVVANEPGAIRATARRGCAGLVLAGASAPAESSAAGRSGRVVAQYLGGSAGGTVPGELSIGPLAAPASVAIIGIAPASGVAIDYQQITFAPDGTVTVGSRRAFPPQPVP